MPRRIPSNVSRTSAKPANPPAQVSPSASITTSRDVPVARARPPLQVRTQPGAPIPFLDKSDPQKQVQEHWVAHVKCYDLSDPDHIASLERVWQRITDGDAKYCEHRIFEQNTKVFQYIRWVDLDREAPGL